MQSSATGKLTASDNINELNRPIRNIDILIQAGAALTPVRVGDFQDNTGDNISEKMCENSLQPKYSFSSQYGILLA
jgi:hypothetical protein